MKRLVATLSLLGVAVTAGAQSFVERTDLLLDRAPPYGPVGVSIIDFNRDGLVDIYRPGLLMIQRPNGLFEDIHVAAGVDDFVPGIQGGAWADYNGDGFPDLVTVSTSGDLRLFTNRGYWRFGRSEAIVGLPQGIPARSATWMDANVDGKPDLVVAAEDGMRFFRQTDFGFQNATQQSGIGTLRPGCGATAGDLDGDAVPELYVSACGPGSTVDHFVAGGISSFRDATEATLFTNRLISRGAVFLDYDRDGNLDVFIVNEAAEPLDEFGAPDRLFRNIGDFRFEPVDGSVVGGAADQAWGVAAADFDNDGWTDLYVTNREGPDSRPPIHRLHRNQGDGSFAEVDLPFTAFPDRVQPGVGDLNGDGWIDLYWSFSGGDRLFFNEGGSNHWLRVRLKGATTNGLGGRVVVWTGGEQQTGMVMAGDGYASQQHDFTAHFGLGAYAAADSVIVYWQGGGITRLGETAGDREVVVVEGLGERALPAPFVVRQPEQGGRIDLSDGDITFTWDDAPASDGHAVLYDLRVFGPGLDTLFVDISATSAVFSPDRLLQGQQYSWTVAARSEAGVRSAMTRHTFRFGGSTVAEPLLLNLRLRPVSNGDADLADYDGDGDMDLLVMGSPLEGGGSSRLYQTVDSLFVEGETLVPFKIFRDTNSILRNVTNGFAAWGDYNGDGAVDLLLGGRFRDVDGNDALYTEQYRNQTNVIRPDASVVALPGVVHGDGEWGDMDGDGDLDMLLAGAMGVAEGSELMADVFVNDGAGNLSALGAGLLGTRFADVEWADYDGDGDLDAFVSGEVSDGLWETSAYRNDAGAFVPVDLGIPTRAFGSIDWADYDDDGDPDLLVAGGEYSPELVTGDMRVLRNDGGILTDIGAERDLAPIAFGDARWVDYDLDGDADILATGADTPYGERVAFVYRNEDGFRFAQEFKLTGLLFSSIAIGDYNGDGDFEVVLVGEGPDGRPATQFLLSMLRPEQIPAVLLER